MTDLSQNITSYTGVKHTVQWTETGVDNSANTPTFAYRLPDNETDATISGSAAVSGPDTIYTVILTAAHTVGMSPATMAYQLHVDGDIGVVAEGMWTLVENYAD